MADVRSTTAFAFRERYQRVPRRTSHLLGCGMKGMHADTDTGTKLTELSTFRAALACTVSCHSQRAHKE